MVSLLPSIPLMRTGPYKQKQVETLLGKSYQIPPTNPEDNSYMPTCASGPCAEYSYGDDLIGEQLKTCKRYSEPTAIPQKTNLLNFEPLKNRTSCGYNTNPVGLFSSEEPTYYVYWDHKPLLGKNHKMTRKGRKDRKSRKDRKGRKDTKTRKNQMAGA